jgi:hypothetical protein
MRSPTNVFSRSVGHQKRDIARASFTGTSNAKAPACSRLNRVDVSFVEGKPFGYFVDRLTILMQAESHEIKRLRRHGGHRGAIVGIVAGRKQIVGVDRRAAASSLRPLQRACKLACARLVDENWLAHQRQIDRFRPVDIGLARKIRIGAHQSSGQESRHIELLPLREIGTHDDRDLRIECHAR